jgi:CBS domain-containing protein
MELARNLKVESVLRLNPTPPVCLPREATAAVAVEVMRRHAIGCVLVTDQGGALLGIFTERDLLRLVAQGRSLEQPLRGLMTPHPVTVTRTEPIASAVQKMERGTFRHLPVIEESGRPVGVLSVKSVVHYLVEHFPSTIYCLPPNPGAVQREREGA